MRYFFVIFLCLTVSACGWQLRGVNQPMALDSVSLMGGESRSRLDIQDVLRSQGLLVINDAPVLIRLTNESWQRRTISVDRQGRASGIELRYQLYWQLTDRDKKPLTSRRQVQVSRSYQVDPANAVAASDEDQLTREIMRREAANVLARQLRAETEDMAFPEPATSSERVAQ
ncbi:MAG: hypothetical protein CVV10_07160 [Gammaproteobacteria bacterium HGW-Gammaproteobacteria-14]|nr:MAG: hypothetical protein CVV10_07160 [Gammaproteobacteria bacterium HGW-Gammaproteobacteria-14]